MEPIQNQDIEPEAAAPPPAPDLPLSSENAGPLEPAAEKWLGDMGVKTEAPAPAERAAPETAGRQPHPQDRLNEQFRQRITRGQRERQLREENEQQRALIEKLSGFLSPLMEAGDEPQPALEMLDPNEADPKDWWARNLELLDSKIDARLSPVLEFIGTQRETYEQQQARQRELREVVGVLESRKQAIAAAEEEYMATDQGQGYLERFAAYAQAQIGFLLEQGYHPNQARQIVTQGMDTILDASQRLPQGPVHPIAWLDRVMQHALGFGGGAPAAAPPQRSPAPPPPSRTTRELQAAASSGVAGSVGQQGRVTPSGKGDLEGLLSSGKLDMAKYKQLLRDRNGGKMPTDLNRALISLQQEVADLAARRARR